ncbi:MAG: hypothetical protein ACRDP6_16525 [Actinoallomurus sp.]
MKRADRLGFVPFTTFIAAWDVCRATRDVALGVHSHAIIPALGAVGWAYATYYLWRPRTMREPLGLGKDGAERWAEILDVDEMPASVRRKVRSVIGVEIGEDGKHRTALNGGLADSMKTALMAAVITSWSFPEPITVESVEDLPIGVYDQLAKATEPHSEAVNFRPPETDGASSSE